MRLTARRVARRKQARAGADAASGRNGRLAGTSTKAVQADRLNVARAFAREHRLVLVLKGSLTIIALPDGTAWVNPTGNPGMATGGTGDILTGMTAGILAQMPIDAARAAVAAVYLHGLAGDVAAEIDGRTFAGRDGLCSLDCRRRFVERHAGRTRAWCASADEYRRNTSRTQRTKPSRSGANWRRR